MEQAKAVRILLVDDHTLFRESLRRLLESESRYEIVAEVASADAAIQLCESDLRFDLALIDFDLGPASGAKNGLAVLRALRERHSDVPVLMITAGVRSKELISIVRDLRAGVFLKADPAAELQVALQRTLRGDIWLSSDVALSLMSTGEQTGNTGELLQLDQREREVLGLVVEGLSNKEMSSQLKLPESTVKAILQKLFQKVGVRTRAQLVRFAFESRVDLS